MSLPQPFLTEPECATMTVMTTSPIRVMVVDDHTLFRRGLTALLSRDPRVLVVGDAADAGEAQRRAREFQPDVILLDNHLPGVRGVDALAALQEAVPGARIVLLTVSEDEADLMAALRNGAAGYLLKTIESDALISAIERAVQGDSVIAPEMTNKMVAAYIGATPNDPTPVVRPSILATLSSRELEILRGIARGSSNKEIGRELGIAEATVKVHVQNVLRKLQVTTRVHAAVLATEIGHS